MRNRARSALMAVAAIGVVAAVAPGLAAGIAVPTTSPAAGQGVAPVQGFEICNIEWTVDSSEDAKITQISFLIARDSDDITCGATGSTVTSADNENSGNAVVRVQLRTPDGTADGDFASCTTGSEGSATCDLIGAQQIKAADLKDVNIIAFDRNA